MARIHRSSGSLPHLRPDTANTVANTPFTSGKFPRLRPDQVGYRGKRGKHLLSTSFSHFDPQETWEALDFCDTMFGFSSPNNGRA
jgi:hypothetical protein